MNALPLKLEVTFFDGASPQGMPATLLLSAREAVLIGSAVANRYLPSALRVAAAVASAERFIELPDGGQLLCRDHPALAQLPQEDPAGSFAHRLEQRWQAALGALVAVVATLVAAYVYVLPVAADWAAARIPLATEAMIGDQAIEWLTDSGWMNESKLEKPRQEEIRQRFAALVASLPQHESYRLEFRHASAIGPNAFALPGGLIVMTDEMVEAAQSDEEILAVLAHEVGHQELRHTLREVLHDSAVAVGVTAITADAASLSVAVSSLPLTLAQTRFSRQFEADADTYAFALLKREGISPDAFADLMERLSKDTEDLEKDLGFISTHPLTTERVARARAAARASP